MTEMLRIGMSPDFVDGWGKLLDIVQEKNLQYLNIAQKRVPTDENDI